MRTGVIITGGRLDLTFAGEFFSGTRTDLVISVDAGLEKT